MRWWMLLLTAVVLFGCSPSPTGKVTQDRLADAVRADPVMGPLAAEGGYTVEIQAYSGAELRELGQKYPVMYGGLSGEIAAVQFSQGASGKLFIYDVQRKEVLREFTTQGVAVG